MVIGVKMPKIYKNKVTEEDKKLGISLVDDFEDKGLLTEFADNPSVLIAPETADVSNLINKYLDMVNDLYKEHLEPNTRLYIIMAYLSLWKEGSYAGLHIDSLEYDGIEVSSVIYLNDDFIGGEINFPNRNKTHKPEAGDIIIFPSRGENWFHEVYNISKGRRYTIAMWLRKGQEI